MLGIVDALERKTEDEGTVVRSLVSDACSIITRCIDKGGVSPCSRKQTVRCWYGITLFVHLGRERKGGIRTEYLSRGDTIHASAMSELQGVLSQVGREDASQVRTTEHQVASLLGIVADALLEFFAQCLLFSAQDKVYYRVVFHADKTLLDGFVAARYEGMITGCLNGLAMHERIVEGIAGYLLAFPFAGAITQSIRLTLSNLRAVESILRATIRSGADVRNTRVTRHVEALQVGRFVGSRTAGTVEAIHDKDSSLILLGMISREDFGRETFATLVHGSYLETIHQSRFCLEGIVIVLHIGTIVPTTVSQSGVDNVSTRMGRWFLGVDNSLP